jgi:WD40 repeat protein
MTNLLDYRSVGSASSFFVKINAVEINGDGSLIAVADATRKLRIFGLEDLVSGAAASITVDCSAEIHSLAWSGSSSRIFSGLSDGTLTVATITLVSGSDYRPPDPSEHHIN